MTRPFKVGDIVERTEGSFGRHSVGTKAKIVRVVSGHTLVFENDTYRYATKFYKLCAKRKVM